MDVLFLGKSSHIELHFLRVNKLGDINDVSVNIMSAELFLQQACGTDKSLGAMRMLAEVFD
jgi:hypothetical protein